MDDMLQLANDERRLYFDQAAAKLGFAPAIVEKDFWVCWTLRVLFAIPDWKEHLLFKGGTSLSKGHGLIKRFSEDIDIVLSREKLGFAGDHSLNNNQLKKLRKACQKAVNGEIREGIQEAINTSPCRSLLGLELDENDPDQSTLLMVFASSFSGNESYTRPAVRIEMGARSDTWPSDRIVIHTILSEALPDAVDKTGIQVEALSPRRTFWEKAMLLHEENFRPKDKGRKARMARHYYDLWCLIQAGIARQAVDDPGLFDSVTQHRQVFFRQSWVDYSTMTRGSLRIVPRPEIEADWQGDYEAMHSFFFPGEHPPAWGKIMEEIRRFEEDFNAP